MLDQYNQLLKKIADSYDKNIIIIKRKTDDGENDLIKNENNDECLLTSKKLKTDDLNNESEKKIICKHAKYSKYKLLSFNYDWFGSIISIFEK